MGDGQAVGDDADRHAVDPGRRLRRLTAGQAHESKSFEDSLDAVRIPNSGVGRPRRRPAALAADKGYSFSRIRRWLHRHKIEPHR